MGKHVSNLHGKPLKQKACDCIAWQPDKRTPVWFLIVIAATGRKNSGGGYVKSLQNQAFSVIDAFIAKRKIQKVFCKTYCAKSTLQPALAVSAARAECRAFLFIPDLSLENIILIINKFLMAVIRSQF